MGINAALDMVELTSMEQGIAWHLQANHFPPVPLSMVAPCMEAIRAYKEEDIDKMISLPEGVLYKGMTTAPAFAIVEQHHLNPWAV